MTGFGDCGQRYLGEVCTGPCEHYFSESTIMSSMITSRLYGFEEGIVSSEGTLHLTWICSCGINKGMRQTLGDSSTFMAPIRGALPRDHMHTPGNRTPTQRSTGASLSTVEPQ